MDQIRVPHDRLTQRCSEILRETGVGEKEAQFVADVLVHADLRGVESHGLIRLEHYVKKLTLGGINLKPNIQFTPVGNSIGIVKGDHGLGHLVARKSMEFAIQLAKKSGVGVIAVTESSHCGALSYFVKMAADEKLIALMTVNTDKLVVPFGGATPYFGTNPIAYAIPANRHKPIVLDMATSTVAYGKIIYAQVNHLSIPKEWGIDASGLPTENPNKLAFLLPFGGAKGYGLSLLVDILSGLLTGSAFGPHIPAMYGDYTEPRGLGHFMLALNPEFMTERFLERVDQLIDELHAVPPSPGNDAVKLPGEIEDRMESNRLIEGVPISQSLYEYLFSKNKNKF